MLTRPNLVVIEDQLLEIMFLLGETLSVGKTKQKQNVVRSSAIALTTCELVRLKHLLELKIFEKLK